jgi:hypothetical protein
MGNRIDRGDTIAGLAGRAEIVARLSVFVA